MYKLITIIKVVRFTMVYRVNSIISVINVNMIIRAIRIIEVVRVILVFYLPVEPQRAHNSSKLSKHISLITLS